jgi:hypothetical protein
MAMLLVVARHDQRSLIDLHLHGFIHLRMQTLDRRAVEVNGSLGLAVVLGKCGLGLV